MRAALGRIFKRYFLAGLLVLVPIATTLSIAWWLIEAIDARVPEHWRAPLGFYVPGIGVALTIVVVLIAGLIARNFFGQRILDLGETIIRRVPLLRVIYGALKQVAEAMLQEGQAGFSRAVLIEYPRRGIWITGFVTGELRHPELVRRAGGGQTCVNVFIPFAPLPSNGHWIIVPEADVIPLEISVQDAFRLILSAGMAASIAPAAEETPSRW